MTGFPIVIGTGPRHSSSRPFPRQRGDNNGDNSSSKSSNPNNVIIATGTNDDETLTATVFISYQFLPISIGSGGSSSTNNNTEDATNNDNDESQHKEQNSNSQEIRKNEVNDDPPLVAVLVPTRFNVIAELRVQISPSTSPFVSNVDAHMSSRETKCRVPLGIMVRKQQTIQTPEQVQQQKNLLSNIDNDDDDPLLNTTTKTLSPNASVIFSSNESHLACLIPFPRRYELVNTTTMTTKTTTTTTTTPAVVSSSVSPQLPQATSTLVVFRIQKQSFTMQQQQRQQKRVLPPLPDYIVEKTSGSNGKGGVTNNYDYAHVVDDNDFTDTTTITMAQEFGVMGITVNDGGGGGEKNTHDNGSTTRKANEMGNINGSRLDSTNQPPTTTTTTSTATTREEPPASFSSSRGNDFMSYVAHEPKIVRVAPRSQELSDDEFLENTNSLPKNNESTHKKNRLFQRKPPSGNNSATANASSSSPLQCATCICNVPFEHNRGRTGISCSSMLMVGSVDGSLVIVNYLSARVHCMLLNNGSDIIPNSNVENSMENPSPGNIRQACNPIVHLAQCPPTQWKPHNIYGEEQGSDSKGRISIIRRDGSAAIYATSFRPPLSFDAPQPSTSSSHHSLNVNGSTSFGSHGVSHNAMLIGEKEMNSVKAAGGKGVGLELQIELLAISRSLNTTEISSPSLRYIRSMWLNPLILVLLTRSPNLDEISLTNTQKNTMAMPVEMTVAQVWTVAEILHDNSLEEVNVPAKNSDMWLNASCPASADISLVSELKLPCGNGDRMEELAHGSFSISQGNVSKPQYDKSDNFIDTDSHEKQRIEDDANVSFFAQCENSTYISYHRGTDCLAISSNVLIRTTSCGATAEVMPTRKFIVRPYVCLWDWKRCAQGLMLISTTSSSHPFSSESALLSRLQLGEDNENGLCAVHIYEKTYSDSSRIHKDVFNLSTLSPSTMDEKLVLDEASPIILQCNSVMFPLFGKSNSRDMQLQWEESCIPSTYIASNGPCRIAAIGKDDGQSIAVAASCGLCILDLSRLKRQEKRTNTIDKKNTPCVEGQPCIESATPNPVPSHFPRWKLFSNVRDEQSFRVLGMVWWERCSSATRTKDDASDDLLLAVIQYSAGDSTPYLVCWSRKRLGFGENQLLEDFSGTLPERNNESNIVSRAGIPLPSGFRIHSMSMMRDPSESTPTTCQLTSSNRAILLLTYASCQEGGNSYVKYAAYQLQTNMQPAKNTDKVLVRLALHGIIPLKLGSSPDLYAVESVTGIFLAGGSFLFDFFAETESHDDHDALVTIGIVTIFQGLIAVCVDRTGPILHRPSVLDFETSIIGDTRSIIVSYWLSGTIPNKNDCRAVWTIAKNDGKVYCWSVPCRNSAGVTSSSYPDEMRIHNHAKDLLVNSVGVNQRSSDATNVSCLELATGLQRHSTIGDICALGQASLWMNSASTNENEIAMGPLGHCTLYAGQRSRKKMYQSNLKSGVDAGTSYHVTNCIVAPPPSTSMLFLSFLIISVSSIGHNSELALMNTRANLPSNTSDSDNAKYARNYIKSSLSQMKKLGSSFSGLRIITMKVIELLNDAKDVRGGESPRIQGFPCLSNKAKVKLLKWAIGKRILVELVSLAKDAYDVLTFTTFFFSIGRQLEPHHFNLIFPLPSHYVGENNVILDTVENMFIAASERGSLGIALSALPLFSCHIISRRRVVQLIYHCLAKIKENVLMRFSETAHTSGEEEIFLHQLFWFGVKLEDAMESLEENRRDEVDQSSLLPNDKGAAANSCQSSIAFSLATGNDDLSSDDSGFEFVSTSLSVESSSSDASSESYFSEECEENRRMSPCRTPKRTPGNGFVSKVVTSLFSLSRKRYSKNDSFEEDAINDAASSFILSGFDSTVKSRQYVHPPENETLELEFLSQEHAESNGNTAHASRHTSLDLSNATVAGAVSIFIGNAIGSGQNIDRDNASFESGWKIVSAIAHLIQGDRETSAITSAGSVNARKISQLVTNEDLLFVAGNYTIHERKKEDYEMIVSFLERRISECEKQLCLEATSIVFNLIVLLLLRHDVCQDVKLNRTSLVIGGIVSGHLSGRLEELVDLSRSNTCMIHDICSSLATRTAELLTMQS